MASDASPPGNRYDEGRLEDILSLVLARSRGEVGNDAVENALSPIVAAHAPSLQGSGTDAVGAPGSNARIAKGKDDIVPDDGNYDDDSEDDDPSVPSLTKTETVARGAWDTAATQGKVFRRREINSREREEALEKIPLGKMGGRMLITFGDGPFPDLEVISAALLGTRASLQRVILDARALRRQLKDKWHQARAVATMHRTPNTFKEEIKKTLTGTLSSVADIELSFKAMDGFSDSLRYEVPCGFDVPQLGMLFPEEMGAYQRWKKMHEAYTANSEEVPKQSDEYDELDNKETDGDDFLEKANSGGDQIISGRLIERLANFDARTNQMGGDWYMKFADVRRGSFLPRSAAGRTSKTSEGRGKQVKKRGRPKRSHVSWQSLQPTSVVFLHWIGFDPRSALSPPNEETTHALGFLAYDFFGKIVERAVSLRLKSGKGGGAGRPPPRDRTTLLELAGGDQLDRGNIEQALAEVDLKSLYSSSNIDLGKSAKIAQLYFGPGFEDRLELEMDEIFGSKEKSLSRQEMKLRKEEETLFSGLPQMPAILASLNDILDNSGQLDHTQSSTPQAKKGRLC